MQTKIPARKACFSYTKNQEKDELYHGFSRTEWGTDFPGFPPREPGFPTGLQKQGPYGPEPPPQEAATRLKDVVCGRWVWGIGKMDVIYCHYALLLPSSTQVSGVELEAEPLYPPGCNEIECSCAKQG